MKQVTLYLIACLCSLAVHAQQVKYCFINMPDSLSPLLTAVNRADCIDFIESNMKAEVSNRLGGKSVMTQLSSDYICIETTPHSTWQMKMLQLTDTTKLICTVSTVKAPAADSHIRFYTATWDPLPAEQYLPQRPALEEFLKPGGSDTAVSYSEQDARHQADILFMEAKLSPDSTTLTFHFDTPQYMSSQAAEKLMPQIGKDIVYHWTKQEEGYCFNP